MPLTTVFRIVLFILNALLSTTPSASGPAPGSVAVRQKLVAVKAAVMSADYRADLTALARLRREAALLKDDAELGYLADYWSGYAGWRLAINGANSGMKPDMLKTHLQLAVADLESSIQKKPDFADSSASAASIHGWLMMLSADDETAAKLHMSASRELLKKATDLDPANPRVLWVKGGVYLFTPAAYGGSIDRAIEIYRKQADSAAPLQPDSPLPDWGKVEALMSIAYADLQKTPPDAVAAKTEAQEALRLEPDWSYVRDTLIPQIETQMKSASKPASCAAPKS